jgi:hypothetical protein
MTKPRVTLTYPATTAYKQWVWKELRRRDWTLQALVDEMKRVDRRTLERIPTHGKIHDNMFDSLSTATLINLLGPEDPKDPPIPSNCAFMPSLNKALGIAPPPVCDPEEQLSQLIDRFRARWSEATPRERDALVALLRKRDDDAQGVDGDRGSAGSTAQRARR